MYLPNLLTLIYLLMFHPIGVYALTLSFPYFTYFSKAYLELVCGVEFRVFGDLIDREKCAIIVMNHRTRLDWMYFWNALFYMDPWLLTTEKIVLKAMLRNIPGAGIQWTYMGIDQGVRGGFTPMYLSFDIFIAIGRFSAGKLLIY